MNLKEGRIRVELGNGYFGICTVGGIVSAGITHVLVTPFDVLKVNMQVNPVKYYSIASCLSSLLREQGPTALWRGWATKFVGYGMQGGCRFRMYEYFKELYSNVLPQRNQSAVFFASSASAEVIANVFLCPFEAVKIRVQTRPSFGKGLLDGFPQSVCVRRSSWFLQRACSALGSKSSM